MKLKGNNQYEHNCLDWLISGHLVISISRQLWFSFRWLWGFPRPALLPCALLLCGWEWRRAGLQGGRPHHPHQPDWWQLVWGHDQRGVWLFSYQLRQCPCAFATVIPSYGGRLWSPHLRALSGNLILQWMSLHFLMCLLTEFVFLSLSVRSISGRPHLVVPSLLPGSVNS